MLTAPGRKRGGIRVLLIQLGLRLLLASVWSQEKEMDKMWQREIRECCGDRDLCPPQHLGSSCCTCRADCVLCQGDMDSVFTSLMLGDQTLRSPASVVVIKPCVVKWQIDLRGALYNRNKERKHNSCVGATTSKAQSHFVFSLDRGADHKPWSADLRVLLVLYGSIAL